MRFVGLVVATTAVLAAATSATAHAATGSAPTPAAAAAEGRAEGDAQVRAALRPTLRRGAPAAARTVAGAAESPAPCTTAYPDASPTFEVGLPCGAAAGTAPKGVVLLLHGGGWYSSEEFCEAIGLRNDCLMAGMRPTAARWQSRGYATLNLDVRTGPEGLTDLVARFTEARQLADAVSPDFPVCAEGESAGGHLVLLLALVAPGLTCAISNSGPTNLAERSEENQVIRSIAALHFCAPWMAAEQCNQLLALWSPLTWASSYAGRAIQLVAAEGDQLVPPAVHVAPWRAVRPETQLHLLGPDVPCTATGATLLVHSCVPASAITTWQEQAEAPFVPAWPAG
ncbi:S9 family peptidase [Conexibacter sp. SYSU D00693]|uniref:alpha/beta hydrolase family protein n=1 Tax=Conexibacter sp. SYSU D00693 TaxID=2812560 RepID=UPI00196A445D|nr:hypothetical protein [Conexibacter sp. SYSU D00693]